MNKVNPLTIQAMYDAQIREQSTKRKPTAVVAPVSDPIVHDSADTETFGPLDADDLDANGLPWDGRIHSRQKSKNADGTWRAKRGVSVEDVATVTAELIGGAE